VIFKSFHRRGAEDADERREEMGGEGRKKMRGEKAEEKKNKCISLLSFSSKPLLFSSPLSSAFLCALCACAVKYSDFSRGCS
jgi:hypothetical protein